MEKKTSLNNLDKSSYLIRCPGSAEHLEQFTCWLFRELRRPLPERLSVMFADEPSSRMDAERSLLALL
jgi:hypothetical protein